MALVIVILCLREEEVHVICCCFVYGVSVLKILFLIIVTNVNVHFNDSLYNIDEALLQWFGVITGPLS